MKCLSEELFKKISQLNARCFQKLEDLEEENKKRNVTEYIIIKYYIQEKDHKFNDLIKATNKSKEYILELVKNLGFISFKNKKPYINKEMLDRYRLLNKDFVHFLNYPNHKELTKSIENINSFMTRKNPFKNFKIILINTFESTANNALSTELVDEIILIIKEVNWAIGKYYFQELFAIYLEFYPELVGKFDRTEGTTVAEPDDVKVEGAIYEDAEQLEAEFSIDIKDLFEQNQKLIDELSESRAVSDFLSMQYDDLKTLIENQKKDSNQENFKKVFLAFNSIENNKVLDAFFIAKSTLDTLKSSGWEPSPPELKSILYIFDLFANFFNKQKLTAKFKLGEVVSITLDNVSNFEYKGKELKPGMEVLARVRTPAWYYKESLISKASLIEIKKGDNR